MPSSELYGTVAISRETRSIRLIRLIEPGDAATTRCDVETFDVDTCPGYTALSYTWGPLLPTKQIEIRGFMVAIRENLWEFFQEQTAIRPGQWYWIDAICIDQSNIDERNHQVGMMRDIYSKAENMIIWLGKATIDSALAMDSIKIVSHKLSNDFKRQIWSKSQGQAVLDLFQHKYWRRVWIIQEVMLGRSISLVYGDRKVPWNWLETLIARLRKLEDEGRIQHHPHTAAVLASNAMRIIRGKAIWPGLTFENDVEALNSLIRRYSDIESTDVRDRIFGLIGLLESIDCKQRNAALRADYSLSVTQVYTEFYRRLQLSHKASDVKSKLRLIELLAEVLRLPASHEAVEAAVNDAQSTFEYWKHKKYLSRENGKTNGVPSIDESFTRVERNTLANFFGHPESQQQAWEFDADAHERSSRAFIPHRHEPYMYGNGAGLPSYPTSPQHLPLPSFSVTPTLDPPQPLNPYQVDFDTTGQIAPAQMRPRVTAMVWEEEDTLCYQVETRGVCVARRDDNHMINGTKLLNVAGMTRGRRDGILRVEPVRHVVRDGPMHLKGVWIPYGRALEFANKERITELLYPLFVHNIAVLLYHPDESNRARLEEVRDEGAAEHRAEPQTA